jgi:hypothetical protein
MRSKNSDDDYIPAVIRGRVVQGVYVKPELAAYAGNPLLEALPRSLTPKQLITRLKYYPVYDPAHRKAPPEIRYQLLQFSSRFFTPLDVHVDIYHRLSNCIRIGYLGRNPFGPQVKNDVSQPIQSFDQYQEQYDPLEDQLPSTATGFHIAGISGIGKSFSIHRILDVFPQVIHHTNYCGRDFTRTQVVWLKLDCPYNGSLKALCISFFKVVDKILRTTYEEDYVRGKKAQEELMEDMDTVAQNLLLGVLVIDEIQRLNLANSGGRKSLLNLIVKLFNHIGLPVVLCGTFDAIEVLSSDLSYLRRGTGQGDLVWDRMKEDAQWDLFVSSLFRAQYTRKPFRKDDFELLTELDQMQKKKAKTLSSVLYEETQGITDLAVKVFMFSQERAIQTKIEKVTANIVRSVAKDKLKMLREALLALKYGEKSAMARISGLYPFFLKEYADSLPSESQEKLEVAGKLGSNPDVKQLLVDSKKTGTARKRRKRVPRRERGELPRIVAAVNKDDPMAGYKALKEAGFIRSPSVYLVETSC